MATPHSFHGLEIAVRSFSGARSLRIVHPEGQLIPDHRHDWPLLTVPVLGGYQEEYDEGVMPVSGAAVVLHPAGRCHANCIHARGMETFSIEFDPAWARINPALLERSYYWIGGSVPLLSRRLVQLWTEPKSSEGELRAATASFLGRAMTDQRESGPRWLNAVRQQLAAGEHITASTIARQLDLHPRWLAHAYRQAAGEGLRDTIVRHRCEHAAHLLRSTVQPIADVAAATGFCDQSHLNRVLGRLTGRTPAQIRSERELLARLAPSPQVSSGERAPSPC